MTIHKIVQPIVAVCLILMTAGSVFAGAWTAEKGTSYHRIAANYYMADESFDDDGNSGAMDWNGEFTDINANYYMEYGILDQLTVILSLYYKDIEREDDYRKNETSGLGDVDLGLRYRLHTSAIGVFSVQGLVKVPELYDEDDALPLGNGQYDYECRLLYGRSLWPYIPGYVNLEAAYRFRDDAPSDEFRYLVEIGSNLGKNVYARAKWDAIISMDNADDGTDAFGNPTSAMEYDLTKLDLTLGWQMTPKVGLEVAYTPAILGKTTAKGETWTLAVTWQPKR
jgi:hypothetical protein